MEQSFIEALIFSTLEKTFASNPIMTDLTKVQDRRKRQVYKLTIKQNTGELLTLFAKIGTDYQLKIESALYQRVFAPELTKTPQLIAANEQDGVRCIIIEETQGEPIDYANRDHVMAAFLALANFHRHNRQYIHKMNDIFTNAPGHANNNPNPQTMFDRIKDVWDRAIHLGFTQDEFDIFYDQRVMDIILSENPTFVHGDFASGNLLIDPSTMTIGIIDFGYSAIRAATSDFMQFFGTQSVLGDLLEPGMRHYWRNSDQGVSYNEFKIRHAYWHGSCYADVFSWKLDEVDLKDQDATDRRKKALRAIQQAGHSISALLK